MIEKFTSDNFPNTHVEFTNEGIRLVITLNIPKDLIHYMPKCKIQKSNKFYVYWVADTIKDATLNKLKACYNNLMAVAMTNIRNAKIRQIEDEKIKIKNSIILF